MPYQLLPLRFSIFLNHQRMYSALGESKQILLCKAMRYINTLYQKAIPFHKQENNEIQHVKLRLNFSVKLLL